MTKTSPSAAEDARTAKCRKLLAELQRTCPEVLPRPPLPVVKPGEVATTATVEPRSLQRLVRSAITPDSGDAFVWTQADDEVVVHAGKTRVVTGEGVVAVALTLECVETDGPTEVVVPFACGSKANLVGMIAATENRPRGPAILVDRWGDAVIATAWQALLDVADSAASGTGTDIDGRPLRAGAIVAGSDGLTITPQAPHDFERAAAT
jgi:hypothetical protein